MKGLVFGDSHIHDDSRLDVMNELYGIIRAERPNVLVLNGDIGDPYKAKWEDIIATKTWQGLASLVQQRAAIGYKDYYIHYNHDSNAKSSYLPRITLCNRYQTGNIVVMHGYEFDGYWDIVHPFAFWMAQHHPKLMIPVYNLLFRGKTPSRLKHGTTQEDWNWKVETVHSRARSYAKNHNARLIIGHTHCPWVFDGFIANQGDMEDSFSYVTFNENAITLKTLKGVGR